MSAEIIETLAKLASKAIRRSSDCTEDCDPATLSNQDLILIVATLILTYFFIRKVSRWFKRGKRKSRRGRK